MDSLLSLHDIRALGKAKGVSYTPGNLDGLALVITQLAGDYLSIGDAEELVLSAVRGGLVSPRDALRMYAETLVAEHGKAFCSSTFDPFGDQESRGYLRNYFRVSDPGIIKKLEHLSFTLGLERCIESLSSSRFLGYPELLGTHRILFQDLYPWAGIDRLATSPNLSISKGAAGAAGATGAVSFAEPLEISRSVEYAIKGVVGKRFVRENLGTILGNLAFAHPFLDGNGRALLTFHREICRRSGFEVAWEAVDTKEYLMALSEEISHPNNGYLNGFLKRYIFEVE